MTGSERTLWAGVALWFAVLVVMVFAAPSHILVVAFVLGVIAVVVPMAIVTSDRAARWVPPDPPPPPLVPRSGEAPLRRPAARALPVNTPIGNLPVGVSGWMVSGRRLGPYSALVFELVVAVVLSVGVNLVAPGTVSVTVFLAAVIASLVSSTRRIRKWRAMQADLRRYTDGGSATDSSDPWAAPPRR